MKKMDGIVCAMLTPFKEDQTIDEQATRRSVNRLISEGIHGLFILGTNGEFFTLSQREKLLLAEIVVDEVRGRVPVCAGTGGIGTQDVIDLTKAMEQVGVDSVSVITPYLMTISQHELLLHYHRIAEATTLPILMYHMPGRTNNVLHADTVATLSRIPNIVGIKDSTGNFDQILKYIEATDSQFSVYAGSDNMILWTLLAGGAGAVAATSNMFPKLVVSIYDHWRNGDINQAKKAQEMLRDIRDASALASTPAVFKKVMELLVHPVGPPRAPVEEVTPDIEERLKDVLKRYEMN